MRILDKRRFEIAPIVRDYVKMPVQVGLVLDKRLLYHEQNHASTGPTRCSTHEAVHLWSKRVISARNPFSC